MSDPVPVHVTMKQNMDYLTDELRKARAEIDHLRAEVAMLTKALDRVAQSNGLASWRALVDEDDRAPAPPGKEE